jgi:hypothetical protein
MRRSAVDDDDHTDQQESADALFDLSTPGS